MNNLLSVIVYVISGVFVSMVCFLSFVKEPYIEKLIIMGIVSLPGLLALVIGLGCARFRNWKRDTGFVLIASTGFSFGMGFTIICVFMDTEIQKMIPGSNTEYLNDYVFGASVMVFLSVVGFLLIKSSPKSAAKPTNQGASNGKKK